MASINGFGRASPGFGLDLPTGSGRVGLGGRYILSLQLFLFRFLLKSFISLCNLVSLDILFFGFVF